MSRLEGFSQRISGTLNNAAGDASADAHVVIPPELTAFWDAIDDDGFELRVCYADGLTLLDYELDDGAGGAFDKANKAGRILIDAIPLAAVADSVVLFWVFFDSGDDPQGDASTATTIAAPIDGYLDVGSPSWYALAAENERPGTERPRHVFHKSSDDTLHLWINYTRFLEQRGRPYAETRELEELFYVVLTAVDDQDADAADILYPDQVRFVEDIGRGGRNPQMWLRVGIKDGDSGVNYTVRVHATTIYPPTAPQISLYRELTQHVGIDVFDVFEPEE